MEGNKYKILLCEDDQNLEMVLEELSRTKRLRCYPLKRWKVWPRRVST